MWVIQALASTCSNTKVQYSCSQASELSTMSNSDDICYGIAFLIWLAGLVCAWVYKVKESADNEDIALSGAILYVFALTHALKYARNCGINSTDCDLCANSLIIVFGLIAPLIGCIFLIIGAVRTTDGDARALAASAAACGLVTLPISYLWWKEGMSKKN